MPFQNFHSCRLLEPSLFKDGSIRTLHTKQEGLTLLVGKLKSNGKSDTESFRYDKKVWTESKAKTHCASHSGHFEPAIKKSIEMDEVIELKKDCVDFDIRSSNVEDLDNDHSCLHLIYRKLSAGQEFGEWNLPEVIAYHSAINEVLKQIHKDLESSDIPELLESSAKESFQTTKKKRKKKCS
jgi:hypothetical protein